MLPDQKAIFSAGIKLIRTKFDYAPILAPGRHNVSKSELTHLFVTGRGPRRLELNFSLQKLIQTLEALSIQCEVWVNGSFACEKESPSDVDVVVVVWHEIFASLSNKAKDFLHTLLVPEEKYDGCIDAFLCVEYPKGHRLYEYDNPEEWAQTFGSENSDEWLKGFAVLEIGTQS